MKPIKYFKLNSSGTKWEETKPDSTKRTVNLYDEAFNFKGIGQY